MGLVNRRTSCCSHKPVRGHRDTSDVLTSTTDQRTSLDVTEGTDADIATARAAALFPVDSVSSQTAMRPSNCRYRNIVIQPTAVGSAFPSISGGTSCDRHCASPCRQLSLLCPPSCCAAHPARHCRNPHQALRFPPSRSKRRRQEQLLCRRRVQRPRPPTITTNGQPAHRPLKRRLTRLAQSWGGSTSWREKPAAATVVAKQVIGSATPPGSDATWPAGLIIVFSRQPAQTRSATTPTRSA